MLTAIVFFCIILLLIALSYKKVIWQGDIVPGEKPVTNPMKGFVAWGENYREDPWVSFVYIPIYWNEIEAQEGIYDFETLEKKYHFSEWRSQGVRFILRVIADSPSNASHMNIPQWLYEAMDGAGTWYDSEYGKGFSPDYENLVFVEKHKKLIQALGKQYADDLQVAFIQLGSLGHWGEWHVNTSADIEEFPLQEITDQYVEHYLEVFEPEKILLRRPYEVGQQGLGLYNDSFGWEESHYEWLDWITKGYQSDQNGEWLDGMPAFWQKAPSGGEFASYKSLEWYFSKNQFNKTIELLKKSHTTFLGPNIPKYKSNENFDKENVETLLQEMGYSLGVRKCVIRKSLISDKPEVRLYWENSGIAPLYGDWPIYVELKDKEGSLICTHEFVSELSTWIPGKHEFDFVLDGKNLSKGETYWLYVGIIDPLTGEPGVALQMDCTESEKDKKYLYRVCEFTY